MGSLRDTHGRTFSYLRLSLTDVCNFRCTYCLPNGYVKHAGPEPLSIPEIRRLCAAFADMGMWKVRLTGGEPAVRNDLVEIVRAVADTPGVTHVALSTNAYRLAESAAQLRDAGLQQVNVSIDSLDRAVFARVTGRDVLPEVLAGVDAALEAGLRVKVNAVAMADVNTDLTPFFAFVRERPVTVRFIQLMQTQDNSVVFLRHKTPASPLRDQLLANGWTLRARAAGDGPAEEYVHPEHAGGMGLIAPYGEGFCTTCNRLRVTSMGRLRLCLFGDGDIDLRTLLQSDGQQSALQARVAAALQTKIPAHRLHEGNPGATHHLAEIGG